MVIRIQLRLTKNYYYQVLLQGTKMIQLYLIDIKNNTALSVNLILKILLNQTNVSRNHGYKLVHEHFFQNRLHTDV